jgi:hypothetical protein
MKSEKTNKIVYFVLTIFFIHSFKCYCQISLNEIDITYPFNTTPQYTTITSTKTNTEPIAYGSYKSKSFNLNWIDYQNYTYFRLSVVTSLSNDLYGAVAFSKDRKMAFILSLILL